MIRLHYTARLDVGVDRFKAHALGVSDKLVVNKLSCCAAVYQCFHCQWMIAVDCVDLDRDIGGPLKYIFLIQLCSYFIHR